MKNSFRQKLAFTFFGVFGLILFGLGAGPAQAANVVTWTGGGTPDGNWQNANNWGGVAPVANDFLVFDGATQTLTTNNFAAGALFGGLTFGFSADLFTLYGNSLTLVSFTNGIDASTVNPIGGNLTNSSFNTETIILPITLTSGRHTIATVGGGPLNLNGAITRNPGATVVFVPAAGTINVSGALSTNGQNNILGGWATLGLDWATVDDTGNVVPYTGYTDIGSGTITSDPTSNVRYIGETSNIGAPDGTQINTLLTAQSVARTLTNSGTLRLGPRGGIYRQGNGVMTIAGGTITADGGGELTFYDNPFNATGGNNINLTGLISNDGPNAVSVNIMGYVQFGAGIGAKSSYSGGTYINQGRVQITPTNGFGTGPVYVFPSGQILFNSNGTYTNDFFIGGVGTAESSGLGAFRMGGAGRIIAGRVTLMGDATIANNGEIRGQITGPGSLFIGHGTSGNGHGVIVVGGPVANDYVGDTTIGSANQAADTLRNAATFNNIMPHGAGKGNLILNGGGGTILATYDLNGTTQIINGLTNTSVNVANNIVTNSSATPATLVVGDNNATSTFGGKVGGALSLNKIGAGTLTLTGPNTSTGANTVDGGTLVFGPGSFPAGTSLLSANNNGNLDLGDVTPLTLGAAAAMSMSDGNVAVALSAFGASITTPALTVGGTTNRINVASIPAVSTYPVTFTAIRYTNLTGTLNFGLGTLPVSPGTPFAAFVSNNVANSSVDVVVTGGPASLIWRGFAGGTPNSTWDILTTINWVTFGGAPTTYPDGSFVQFDDTSSNNIVTLAQDVSPAGTTLTNNSLTYTLNGPFKIGGTGSLIKRGSGTVVLDNSSANDFSGGVFINNGTLQIGNNDSGGSLPATGGLVDNGTLAFNRSDILTVPNVISGTGGVAQNGSGILILGAANTFNGPVTVASGATLQLGSGQALGTTNSGTTISNGGTLDFGANANNIGAELVTASGGGVLGSGAIVNNSGSPTFVAQNMTRLTLVGDTTIGGSGRWDLRSNPTSDPTQSSLSTGGQPYNLTKVGGNQISIVGVTVDPALGDIDIQAGILSVETATTTLGNTNNTFTVRSGAALQTFAPTNRLNKRFVVHDGGTVANTSGASTILGPMNLTNSSLSGTPYCTFNIGGTSLTLDGPLTGDAILYKVTGASPLTLNGNSPDFAGGVLLSAGNLTVNGVLSNNLGVAVNVGKFILNGALLGAGLTNTAGVIAGSGSCTGPVDTSGLVLPGDTNAVGTLTVGSLLLQPGAPLSFELTATNTVGSGTNDLLVVNGDLTINGNPVTINPVGLLKVGPANPYRLVNYTGNLIWNSDLAVTGPNNYVFTVDTNTPGQINIVATGGPPVWNGGSLTVDNWSDPANWSGHSIQPNEPLFFAGGNRLNNINDTAAGTQYGGLSFNVDAGPFVLNGNPIVLAGSISSLSPNPQTVLLPLGLSGNSAFSGTAGTLIIGGPVTNTANGSTLTLTGTGILSNRLASADPPTIANTLILDNTNANWTLADNPSATPVTIPMAFDMQAGTLSFGQGSSAPVIDSTSTVNTRLGVISGSPATFNMVNGTLTIGVRFNTGTAANTLATLNQSGGTINVFDVFQASDGNAAAVSFINVSGGVLNVGEAEDSPNSFFLCSRGTGTLTVSGSGMVRCGTFDVSRNASSASSTGRVNLDGGTMDVARVGTATSAAGTAGTPTAMFNFNGGRLKARQSAANFFQGNPSGPAIPITSIVKLGGAIIDSSNFNITISESLQHDSTLGATPDGGLTKLGTGTLTLGANATYTGPTLVNEGTLAVNSSAAATLVTVATNATLSGTGTAGKSVTVNQGGTVSPAGASAIGTLTVAGNVTLQPNSTTAMDLNKTLASSDLLRATTTNATTISYGGTLALSNLAGTLTGSETFKLFSASNYTGSFSALSPSIPAPGLAWNTNTLTTDGILRLVVTVDTTPTNLTAVASGGILTLTWPASHTGWRLQVQTNSIASGLGTNWVTVGGSQSVNSTNFPIDPANGAVFYRLVFP